MRTMVLACISIAAFVDLTPAQQPTTQADLLRRVIDLQRLATPPPAGERTVMFSSYDRRSRIDENGNQVDWDANQDWGQFIRKEADGWDVMAELKGPGAITRIWSANPQGQIRLILDGENVIDTTFDELLSGCLPPFEEPLVYRGLNCYFPIGFNRSCKVACRDCKSYYQINTVQFPPGTQVQRFKPELDDAAQATLAEVKAALTEGLSDRQLFGERRMMPVATQQDIGPGEVLSETLEGAGTVRALYVALTDRNSPHELYALHRCVLRVFADGEKNPSVEAPLTDFFGSGFDLAAFNSLVVGTDKTLSVPLPERRPGEDRYMYCHFPLPFRNGLTVELENLNEAKRKIGLLLHMWVDTRPPAADALRFHARFRKEDPCQVLDYPILQTTARGRIVGCVLNVDCPRAQWWGEGDDKVWIDGEKFPSYFGTGSEDYLGDAWGLHPHIRPLQGATRVAPYGKNSAYRWHIADCINFQKSVRFTIENLQAGGLKDTYYSTVVYWYGEPGVQSFFKRLKPADLAVPGLRIPGAIEIEDQILSTDWGNVVKQKHVSGVEFSGGEAAALTTEQPVQINIPSDTAQPARLKLRVHPRRPFETIAVTDAASQPVGTVTYSRVDDGIYVVGVIHLEKGKNRVTVQCSKPALLDCWIVEPLAKTLEEPEGEEPKVPSSGQAKP